MKKLFLSLFFVFSSLSLFAYEIVVKSFEYAPFDQTANSPKTERIDQNNERCALIKVETTEKGFNFNVGILGVWEVDEDHVGEIWLYVPHSVNHITIQHAKYGTLRNYIIPTEVRSACTYIMKLEVKKNNEDYDEIRQQFVSFHIQPKEALVVFNGSPIELDEDGNYDKLMPFGEYDYQVSAQDYHTDVGSVKVNSAEKKVEVYVTLKPNFGSLQLSGESSKDAVVYVDNKKMGTVPVVLQKLKSGKHRLMLVKTMYKSYEQTINIEDGKTLTLTPQLLPNFSTITFTVQNDAEIWVNGQKKGTGSVRADFEEGSLMVECKKQSHTSTIRTIQVEAGKPQTIELEAPQPIYGQLTITSKPTGANVMIDNKTAGTTPLLIPKQLIGSHNITVSKSGYEDYKGTVSVQKNMMSEFSATLAVKKEEPKPVVQQNNNSYGSSSGSNNSSELTFTANGVSFKMIFVEGGTFTMGCTSEQGSDCWDDEKPSHSVTLSNYYIGQTEVTQALWKAVMGSNPSNFMKGDNYPVEYVSWNECKDFVAKLNSLLSSQLGGKRFALPTEAQWEYAARGGRKSNHYKYSGSNTIGNVAWYNDNSNSSTHPVATKSPNELGLYDMTGNVWEWCYDKYGSYTSFSQINPQGASSGSFRVMRGGCCYSFAGYCRVSDRYYRAPGHRIKNIGARLVLVP